MASAGESASVFAAFVAVVVVVASETTLTDTATGSGPAIVIGVHEPVTAVVTAVVAEDVTVKVLTVGVVQTA